MAKSFCKVQILGNLGKNPELRHTGNGTPVVNLSVATNHGYTDRDGNWVEQTEWHRVVAFGRLAENCAQQLRKGSQILVEEARLQTRSWNGQDGVERFVTEVKAFKIQFMDRNRSGDGQREGGQDRPAKQGQRQPSARRTVAGPQSQAAQAQTAAAMEERYDERYDDPEYMDGEERPY